MIINPYRYANPSVPILFGMAGTPVSGGFSTRQEELWTPYSADSTGATFDAAGICDSISLYVQQDGQLRVWAGTWSGTTFVFDSYTAVIDIANAPVGLSTFTAPTDFTAFAVTANTALAIYCEGGKLDIEVAINENQSPAFSGMADAKPPYSSSIAMSQSTNGVLQFKATGMSS